MTARLLPLSATSLRENAWLGDRTSKQNVPPVVSPVQPALTSPSKLNCVTTKSVSLDGIWNALVESLPQGVLVLTPELALVYANYRAKELCQQLAQAKSGLTTLPAIIFNICRRFVQEDANHEPLVVEIPSQAGGLLRLWVRWLHNGPDDHAYLWVQVENCDEVLRQELWLEQKKYNLTERESEIWILMRQEYTYLEIAKMLQISSNTVKTHVKHIYGKRHSSIHKKAFWASR
jgi:DNA-binding CsgD family transcriptional regulator